MLVPNDPRVSVAVCTYRGQAYLKAQLDSIAQQTRLPDEIIIVDDNSQDATLEVAKAFAKSVDLSVQVLVNQPQLGVTKNFEKAISICSGEIIVLADQDDVWHPEKLQIFCAMFAADADMGLVFSNADVVDEDLHTLGYSFWQTLGFDGHEQAMVEAGDALTVLLRRNVVAGATMAFRSKFRDLYLPIETTWPHDAWIVLLLAAVSKVGFTQQCLIQYRQHHHNVCGAREKQDGLREQLNAAQRTVAQDYLNKAERYQLLVSRLQQGEYVSILAKQNITGCVQHLKLRASIACGDVSWLKRWRYIGREVVNKHYFLYSGGWRSVLKDMFAYTASK